MKKNITFQNLWDATKSRKIVRGKFIVIQAYLKKQEKTLHINNLTFNIKELRKEEQKVQSEQKGGNNKGQSGNKIETKTTIIIEKINETKS